MGSAQSNNQEERPSVVRINREDIPEEYRSVVVSNEVVKRVAAAHGAAGGNSEEAAKLRAELERERAEKARLREEMAKLSELQARKVISSSGGAGLSSLSSDVEERKRVFDETVERVQKQFFPYQRENVCRDNEEILECLKKNPGKVLKCRPLADIYEKCVADYRTQVLSGN